MTFLISTNCHYDAQVANSFLRSLRSSSTQFTCSHRSWRSLVSRYLRISLIQRYLLAVSYVIYFVIHQRPIGKQMTRSSFKIERHWTHRCHFIHDFIIYFKFVVIYFIEVDLIQVTLLSPTQVDLADLRFIVASYLLDQLMIFVICSFTVPQFHRTLTSYLQTILTFPVTSDAIPHVHPIPETI